MSENQNQSEVKLCKLSYEVARDSGMLDGKNNKILGLVSGASTAGNAAQARMEAELALTNEAREAGANYVLGIEYILSSHGGARETSGPAASVIVYGDAYEISPTDSHNPRQAPAVE